MKSIKNSDDDFFNQGESKEGVTRELDSMNLIANFSSTIQVNQTTLHSHILWHKIYHMKK